MPVLVGIDEESLAAYGQWPWPRYRLAQLVDRLWLHGAEVVVLDFLMPEPDRSSPEVIRAERRRDGLDATESTAVNAKDGNSDRLAAALGRGKAVLAVQLDFSGSEVLSGRPAPVTPCRHGAQQRAGQHGRMAAADRRDPLHCRN